MGGDELADDGARERKANVHAQDRDDPGNAGGRDQLGEDLPPARAKGIEELLLIAIHRLHARIGGEGRDDERQRRRYGDLGRQPHAEDQNDQRRESQLGDRFQADDIGLHDQRIVARPPEGHAKHGAERGAKHEAHDGGAEGVDDVSEGVSFGEEDHHGRSDGGWLRPEEGVDQPRHRGDFPQRHKGDEDAQLHAEQDPCGPDAAHRQSPCDAPGRSRARACLDVRKRGWGL